MKAMIPIMLTWSAIIYSCKKEDTSIELNLNLTNAALKEITDEKVSGVMTDWARLSSKKTRINQDLINENFLLMEQLHLLDKKINLIKHDSITDFYAFINDTKLQMIMHDFETNPLAKNRYTFFYKYKYVDQHYTKQESLSQLLLLKNDLISGFTAKYKPQNEYISCFYESPHEFIKINENELVVITERFSTHSYYDIDSIKLRGVFFQQLLLPESSMQRKIGSTFESYHLKYPGIGNAQKNEIRIGFTTYFLKKPYNYEEYWYY